MKLKDRTIHNLIQLLKHRFPGYPTDPIHQGSDYWGGGDDYICWEEGPYEWAMKVTDPDNANYIDMSGVFLEPYNSFVLSVVPETFELTRPTPPMDLVSARKATGMFLTNGVWSDEPAGYQYLDSNLCPEHMIQRLIDAELIPDYAKGVAPERVMNEWAKVMGFNRDDEYSYDADDFPKVATNDDFQCDVCGGREF